MVRTLKKKREFDCVFNRGKWVSSKGALLKLKGKFASDFRYAVIASRKTGNAVKRNKAKRQIREIIRELLLNEYSNLTGHLAFILTREFVALDYHLKNEKIKKLFKSFLAKQNRNFSN